MTATPVAVLGPALLTVTANVTLLPTAGVALEAVLVKDRSATGVAPGVTVAKSSPAPLFGMLLVSV